MANRALTDHRYKINNGDWISCNSENTIDNGNGTFTINVGNVNIPIGGLQVQVKAIGINPPSASLTNSVAFTGGGSITFKFPNTSFFVNTMSLADADQLLSYLSDSDGAVSFTSSNPEFATIIFSGGNYFLHPVSEGTTTITLNQEPDGDYDGISLEYSATVVLATSDPDITYGNVTQGIANTAENGFFNILDQNPLVLRKYKITAGKAVYFMSVPNNTLKIAKRVKEIIYSESLGVMPGGPVVDADSIYALYHSNTLRNIGNVAALPCSLLHYRYRAFRIITENGGGSVTKISDVEQIINFPAQTGQAFSAFFMLTGGAKTIPPGTWTIAVELKTAPGDGSKTFYNGRNLDSPNGLTYLEMTVTEEYSTFVFPVINLTDFTTDSYSWLIAPARTGTHGAATLYVRNWRFVPGAIDTGIPPTNNDLTLSKPEESLHLGINSNLDLTILPITVPGNDGSGRANSLAHVAASNYNLWPFTIMLAMKVKPSNDDGQYTTILSNGATEGDWVVLEGDGKWGAVNAWWAQATLMNEKSFNYREDTWYILTLTTNGNVGSIYINGQLVNRRVVGVPNTSTKRLDFFGGSDSFAAFAKFSGVTYWKTALTDSQIQQAASLMANRMRLKNHHLTETHNFYIAEGDSITHLTNSYQKLLRKDYTPNLQGALAARDGSVLGNPGDIPNDDNNTVFARKARVEQMISSAVAAGKNVVLSVLIGTNDIGARLNTSAAVLDYYNKLMEYIADMRALGAKVVASTIMDCPPFYAGNPNGRALLEELNSLIVSDSSKYDGLANYFANPHLNIATSEYFYDLAHPNAAGFQLMKEILKPVYETLI